MRSGPTDIYLKEETSSKRVAMLSKKILISCFIILVPSSLTLIWWTHTLYNGNTQAQLQSEEQLLHATSDIANRINGHCKDKTCSQYLIKTDRKHFKYCIKKTWKTRKHPEPEASVCRFINGADRNPVALASYPGSGNTWVRGLLQEVTRLCTGGVYCDPTLRQDGFPGERIGSGVVLVVKTHQPDPRWSGVQYDKDLPLGYYHTVEEIPLFSGAILLARNPFDAMVAEYNRKLNMKSTDNHIIQSRPEKFGENKEWDEFVSEEAIKWEALMLSFLVGNQGHPVIVVRYEDLRLNIESELRRMLDFLQVPYHEAALRRVAQTDYTKYRREKQQMVYYTREQRDYVFSVVQETVNTLAERSSAHADSFEDYLRSDIPTV